MNYKDEKNIEELFKFKNKVLKDISELLDDEIYQDQKRVANISYWLRDFKNYLKQEKTFDPKYLPIYPYGSIIEVNLGFNVGNEFGGLHYAIVMNVKDSKYNPNLTIIPLSSMKPGVTVKDLHRSEIYLSDEFYNLVRLKIDTSINYIENELIILKSQKHGDIESLNKLQKELSSLHKCHDRFLKMKLGSYALTSHITTVSKMRVKDPISRSGTLSGIVLSSKTMQRISDRLGKNTCAK